MKKLALVKLMNKLALVKLIYNNDIKNIDLSIPLNLLKNIDNSFYYIMNYNNNFLGTLEDIRKTAKKRNIKIK